MVTDAAAASSATDEDGVDSHKARSTAPHFSWFPTSAVWNPPCCMRSEADENEEAEDGDDAMAVRKYCTIHSSAHTTSAQSATKLASGAKAHTDIAAEGALGAVALARCWCGEIN